MAAAAEASLAGEPFVMVSPPPTDASLAPADDIQELLTWFAVPGPALFPYSNTAAAEIRTRRSTADMQGSLFFDELLRLALDEAGTASAFEHLYPPSDPAGLQRLLKTIDASGFDRSKRDAMLYYLLLDHAHGALNSDAAADSSNAMQADDVDEASADLRRRPAAFARQMLLPPQFRRVMKGYWHLDRGQYQQAVPFLTAADFIDKILHCLSPLSSLHPSPAERSRIFTSFVRVSRLDIELPSYSAPDDDRELRSRQLESHVLAACFNEGVAEAWQRCRQWTEETKRATFDPEEADEEQMDDVDDEETLEDKQRWVEGLRGRLVGRILEHCFLPTPRPEAIPHLISLVLTPIEEELLALFCLSPPPSLPAVSAAVAAEILLVRYVNSGRFLNAVALDRRLESAGLSALAGAEGKVENVERLARLRERRKQIVRGALAVLPEVQRSLLEIDVGAEGSKDETEGGAAETQQVDAGSGDVSMANSWTAIARPANASPAPAKARSSLTPLSASTALRNPPAGSPRARLHSVDPQSTLLQAVMRASPKQVRSSPKPRRSGIDFDGSGSDAASLVDRPTSYAGSNSSLIGVATAAETRIQTASPLAGFLTRHPDLSGPRPSASPLASRVSLAASGSASPALSQAATPTKASRGATPGADASSRAARLSLNNSLLSSQSPFAGPPRSSLGGGAASGSSAGPLARLAAQLEAEVARGSSPGAVLNSFASSNALQTSPSGGGVVPSSSSSFMPPVRRYAVTSQIVAQPADDREDEDEEMEDGQAAQDEEEEPQEEIPRRRGGARAKAAERQPSRAKAEEVKRSKAKEVKDEESVPGSFPDVEREGDEDATSRKGKTSKSKASTASKAQGRSKAPAKSKATKVEQDRAAAARRVTRSQSVVSMSDAGSDGGANEEDEEEEGDDTIGEIPPTPARASRAAQPQAGASSRLRRSSRLSSAEPEASDLASGLSMSASTSGARLSKSSSSKRVSASASRGSVAAAGGKAKTPARRTRASSAAREVDADGEEKDEDAMVASPSKARRSTRARSTMPGGF